MTAALPVDRDRCLIGTFVDIQHDLAGGLSQLGPAERGEVVVAAVPAVNDLGGVVGDESVADQQIDRPIERADGRGEPTLAQLGDVGDHAIAMLWSSGEGHENRRSQNVFIHET